MSQAQYVKQNDLDEWRWPVDLNQYDRHPWLREGEQEALEDLVEHINQPYRRWPRPVVPELQRIFQPVYDVLDIVESRPRSRYRALRFLSRQMKQRRSSVWAWTETDWIAILTHLKSGQEPGDAYHAVMAVAYFLGCFTAFHQVGTFHQRDFACKVFGESLVSQATQRIVEILLDWGYGKTQTTYQVTNVVSELMLANRSPRLDELSDDILREVYEHHLAPSLRRAAVSVSRALVDLGIVSHPLPAATCSDERHSQILEGVAPEWATWCLRWRDTSAAESGVPARSYYKLLKAGRWLAHHHPEVTSPAQWTRQLAIEYVSAVDKMRVGEWTSPAGRISTRLIGKPLSARTKRGELSAIRTFFRDCQEWGWIPVQFDPHRYLATPTKIRAQLAPHPRVIADDLWAKLLWAGLNLVEDDLPKALWKDGRSVREGIYPIEMVQALIHVWLFAGLRSDEIRRLPVGCIRWQPTIQEYSDSELGSEAVCLLDVPVNKTGPAFTKPVARLVGTAIEAWEAVRPHQPPAVDRKTGELVHYLFSIRGKQIGSSYINKALIPLLCRKAGIPESDARGKITSHRARATIASQLANAREPMTLFELQQWLGHQSAASTQHYLKITPTKLARAYADAGYFDRNVRMIQVLIDQDVVKSGAAASGETWRYYDLGHGCCSYDFFDQCPHRMACAKCTFYVPKDSSQSQFLEAKTNLQKMLQEIPLTDDERAAVEDGLEAVEALQRRLWDVPTPSGLTPHQMQQDSNLIPLAAITAQRELSIEPIREPQKRRKLHD